MWAAKHCSILFSSILHTRDPEYFMLKQCLENIGEGLLHACISSIILNLNSVYKINDIVVKPIPAYIWLYVLKDLKYNELEIAS